MKCPSSKNLNTALVPGEQVLLDYLIFYQREHFSVSPSGRLSGQHFNILDILTLHLMFKRNCKLNLNDKWCSASSLYILSTGGVKYFSIGFQ